MLRPPSKPPVLARLQLPEKMAGIWNPCRYKVMDGGRGSGKSWGVAQVLTAVSAEQPKRILCGREIQRSIRDSVHRLLADTIQRLNVGYFFTVLDNEIRGINGSLFIFTGLQTHTIDSIKSYEGVDIVWLEEAHSVSKRSWEVLIPTIRKEGSEIWMTLNPDLDTDYTYQTFIATPRDDVWRCHMNWRDNPWFPATLDAERRRCKVMNPDDYEHIWEGKPRRVAEGAIYQHEIDAIYEEGRVCNVPYDASLPVHTVWDLGWNDAMTIICVQRGPQDLRIIDYIEDSHRTLDWYLRELEKRPYHWGSDFLPHDGATRNFQTGRSTQQQLISMGRRNVRVLGAMGVEEGIKAARMTFSRCFFDKTKAARLVECLRRYRREVNTRTEEPMRPRHDEYSHGADAFRYLAQAAELMDNTGSSRRYVPAPAPVYM
ncbi:MAG: PBSX family phage terminase large subunit [Ottowia sp.]|nr:PBSX family phage terminase large subunit [Ottowia sp.]